MNPWIAKAKAYMAKHHCSFKDAQTALGAKKGSGKKHSSKKRSSKKRSSKKSRRPSKRASSKKASRR